MEGLRDWGIGGLGSCTPFTLFARDPHVSSTRSTRATCPECARHARSAQRTWRHPVAACRGARRDGARPRIRIRMRGNRSESTLRCRDPDFCGRIPRRGWIRSNPRHHPVVRQAAIAGTTAVALSRESKSPAKELGRRGTLRVCDSRSCMTLRGDMRAIIIETPCIAAKDLKPSISQSLNLSISQSLNLSISQSLSLSVSLRSRTESTAQSAPSSHRAVAADGPAPPSTSPTCCAS